MNWVANLKLFNRNTNDTNNEELIDSNGLTVSIYHEKQVKEMCALHALNNLFQENFFSKSILDKICLE
jgi:hypothetical protein